MSYTKRPQEKKVQLKLNICKVIVYQVPIVFSILSFHPFNIPKQINNNLKTTSRLGKDLKKNRVRLLFLPLLPQINQINSTISLHESDLLKLLLPSRSVKIE